MSNQGGYNYGQNPYQHDPPPAHDFHSSNPWSDQSGNPPPQQQYQPYQQQPSSQPSQGYGAYQPPPGPPPSHQQGQHDQYAPPSGPPPGFGQPKRAETFRESDFVPDSERGEQREAMQQFEMNHSAQPKSQEDRDVEALQQEFPSMDGALVASLYRDAGSLGATREMLMELDGK